MVKDKRSSKDELSDFFKAARSASPGVNSNLKARILRDAEKIDAIGYKAIGAYAARN